MRIFKLKQEVITRATRKNEAVSVPRKLTVRTFSNAYDHGDKVIEMEYQDTFTVIDVDEFNNTWIPLINNLYDEETHDG